MNVKSTFICAQSAARAMIASGRRGGKILTLGSIHGVLSADKRLYEGLTVRTAQGRLSTLSVSR
jgi:NAD(P)-dependent dehydrogenase (short-subunit alcohol dehydrogenase family)